MRFSTKISCGSLENEPNFRSTAARRERTCASARLPAEKIHDPNWKCYVLLSRVPLFIVEINLLRKGQLNERRENNYMRFFRKRHQFTFDVFPRSAATS